MERTILRKEAFSVIGKEGSTRDGEGVAGRLWTEANSHFDEVAPLALRETGGAFAGFWGLMTDFSRSFLPWEEGFTQGLYLAGVEALPGAEPPAGWVKWTAPASEYLRVKIEGDPGQAFGAALAWMREQGMELAGAAYDFLCPAEDGQLYMFFPLRRL